jgi:hypothetical protein
VSSRLPGVKRLLLLVEKNPSALAAMFDVSDAVDANFNTRVKMGQSSNVYRRGDDGRRQGAVRQEGNQGHAGWLRRLTGPPPKRLRRSPSRGRRLALSTPDFLHEMKEK